MEYHAVFSLLKLTIDLPILYSFGYIYEIFRIKRSEAHRKQTEKRVVAVVDVSGGCRCEWRL